LGSLRVGEEDDDGGIQIPDGWSVDYWLGRPVWAGMCRWSDLCDGTLSMIDLMDMHRSLNLKEWLERKSYEQAEGKG
jgi:hypothetical protein